MNTIKFFAPALIAAATLGSSHAFADSIDRDYLAMQTTTSAVTRAQVRNELARAKGNSRVLLVADSAYPGAFARGVTRTRSEVRAELEHGDTDEQEQGLRN